MKITFLKDFGSVKIELDQLNIQQDIEKLRILEKLYNSTEWYTLLEVMGTVEEKLDDAVMKVRPQEQSFREVAILAARKNGFCEAMGLLKKCIDAYTYKKIEVKQDISDQVDHILGKEDFTPD